MVTKLNTPTRQGLSYEDCHKTCWDNDSEPDVRITEVHPAIGRYLVRVSIMMYDEAEAGNCCAWLNQMVADRNGIIDRFKVLNYKGSSKTFVVARRVLPNDRVEAIDEQIEIKSR
jgi:hypothetical protein